MPQFKISIIVQTGFCRLQNMWTNIYDAPPASKDDNPIVRSLKFAALIIIIVANIIVSGNTNSSIVASSMLLCPGIKRTLSPTDGNKSLSDNASTVMLLSLPPLQTPAKRHPAQSCDPVEVMSTEYTGP